MNQAKGIHVYIHVHIDIDIYGEVF